MPKREKKTNCADQLKVEKNDLSDKIKKITKNLYYTSETDAKIMPFRGEKAEAVTASEIINQTKCAEDSPIEEIDFCKFFAPLTAMQDWYGDEEKASAKKYAELKDLLEKNLRDLKVFKLGKIQLDVYAVGLDAENYLAGIKTRAVET